MWRTGFSLRIKVYYLNVIVLYKGVVEISSNYLGVVNIPIDNLEAWKFNLAKELKQTGILVN